VVGLVFRINCGTSCIKPKLDGVTGVKGRFLSIGELDLFEKRYAVPSSPKISSCMKGLFKPNSLRFVYFHLSVEE
jgi:hypothetical protein